MDNLPDGPGHIVVMNHLTNDPADILPNGMRLPIDTHFVSSMIVFGKYGRAPIRVVRKSPLDEYAHQMYYDRLGYICVFRADLDPAEIDPADWAQRRCEFHAQASAVLQGGDNIAICPEGNSTDTENSPLPFKSGVFRLARALDPEPMIVPVSVANLDNRLATSRLAAIVHEPFRMSDQLPRCGRGATARLDGRFPGDLRRLGRGHHRPGRGSRGGSEPLTCVRQQRQNQCRDQRPSRVQ